MSKVTYCADEKKATRRRQVWGAVRQEWKCGSAVPAESQASRSSGQDTEGIRTTAHPRPMLSQTVTVAAEMAVGSATDLVTPQRR